MYCLYRFKWRIQGYNGHPQTRENTQQKDRAAKMEESKGAGKGMSRGTLPGPTLRHGLETGFGEQDKDGSGG